tara:strand:+ start:227 stop:727 length:501 start_codon:yes stop_codon:yes gene_type:complete
VTIEIERRFIVTGEDWKNKVISSQLIRQGYLSTNFEEWIVRLRINETKESKISLKSSLDGYVNTEFEYSIPIQDAETIWNKLKQRITKHRHYLNLYGGYWTVDCFKDNNSPLKIAEVELKDEKSTFVTPNWCGQEITGFKELSNAALSKHPMKSWTKKEKQLFQLD